MALDPSYFFYGDGTISVTNGSDIATGDMTAWDPAVLPFDFVFPNDGTAGLGVIKEVLAMDQIRLAKPWTGPTLTNVPYTMVRWTRHTDPRIYAVRVSDYLARLKAIPENIEEVAGEINADRQAVDAAMTLLSQIEANVDADRQAVQTAAEAAQGSASAAAQSASTAQQWAEAASTAVLPDNSVTNTKLADMAVNTIKGRISAGTGDPDDLTAAQVRSLLNSDRAAFRAHKNGVNQTGIASGVITKVTFGTEAFDSGGHYDTATSRWTPPPGFVRIHGGVVFGAGFSDQIPFWVAVYKNGTEIRRHTVLISGTVAAPSADVSVVDQTDGTAFYEIYFFSATGTTMTITGVAAVTYFEGYGL